MEQTNPRVVTVFGSLNADASYRVPTLPAPGETVLAAAMATSPGGKGANQAIAAAAAGSVTRMVGVVGDDPEGESLLRALAARGVTTDTVATLPGGLTGRAVVMVDSHGENSIIVLAGVNALLNGDPDGSAAALASMTVDHVLVLQNEVPASASRAAARVAQRAGATVVWNAAPAPATPDDLVHDIDLLVVNETELVQLAALLGLVAGAGRGVSDIQILLAQTVAAMRIDGRPAPQGVCTLGAAGSVFVDGERSGHVAAPAVTAVDTTAAGDTVVGYLAAHAGLPLEDRMLLAGAAGALTVTRAGASSSIPSLAEVERMLTPTPERTTA